MKSTLTLLIGTLMVGYTQGFNNPVIPKGDNPDPGAIFHNGKYYVVTTSNDNKGDRFPIRTSVDLQNWNLEGYAIHADKIGKWIGPNNNDFWAPEIHHFNGQFYLYYTARDHDDLLCIGVATSPNIMGPYIDSGMPLVKNTSVGSIDATFMKVGNDNYLVWKDDSNGLTPQKPTWIWGAQLGHAGINVIGQRVPLIVNDLAWEGPLVEAPWIIQNGKYYYLFYSGNGYCGNAYAVGVARSINPLGPYEKKGEPIRKSDATFIGPGHCSVLKTPQGQFVMIYHSWIQGEVCTSEGRKLMVDYITFGDDGWPKMSTSSSTPFIAQ